MLSVCICISQVHGCPQRSELLDLLELLEIPRAAGVCFCELPNESTVLRIWVLLQVFLTTEPFPQLQEKYVYFFNVLILCVCVRACMRACVHMQSCLTFLGIEFRSLGLMAGSCTSKPSLWPSILFSFIYYFIKNVSCVWVFCLHVSVVYHTYLVPVKARERVSDPLDRLKMV